MVLINFGSVQLTSEMSFLIYKKTLDLQNSQSM
jgi:hypothetical protein